jgi:hypothetical protein
VAHSRRLLTTERDRPISGQKNNGTEVVPTHRKSLMSPPSVRAFATGALSKLCLEPSRGLIPTDEDQADLDLKLERSHCGSR